MGAFDKKKKEIKRDLKKQKTDLAKAKKLAEALFLQLEGAEGRLDQTEQNVDHIPGNEIDTAFKLIRDKKDSPHIKDQLQQLAQRVIATTPARQPRTLKSSMGIRRIAAPRATRIVAKKVVKKASTKGASKKTSAASTSKVSAKSGGSKAVSIRKPPSIWQATITAGGNVSSVKDEDEDESNINDDGSDDMEEE